MKTSIELCQARLESWWNEDPEMRYVEICCGQNLRVCVRYYQITLDGNEPTKVAEAEAGTLSAAIQEANSQVAVAAVLRIAATMNR